MINTTYWQTWLVQTVATLGVGFAITNHRRVICDSAATSQAVMFNQARSRTGGTLSN